VSAASDPAALRAAFGHFPTGVAALCAQGPDGPAGMVVSTFVPVSLEPPLIAVCLQSTSSTWPVLRGCERIGVSVLAAEHDAAAFSLSKRTGDRFAGVRHSTTDAGSVRIAGCSAWFDCEKYREVEAGDHVMALMRVVAHESDGGATAPLVVHRSRFGSVNCDV
jgi:flavin reductase (DIM6/NTAB) family NADH-FMN oxidoreductase RutF